MYLSIVFLLGMPSPMSWLLIFGALLLLFGGKKLPELMKGLGTGIKEFKDATKEEKEEKEEITSSEKEK